MGKIQKKLLLILFSGVSIGLSRNTKQQLRIFKELGNEWKNAHYQTLHNSLRGLYESRFVKKEQQPDGSIKIVLTDKGVSRAIIESPDALTIKKSKKWDGYFWVVLFDVPETRRKIRDALRFHLKKMKFYELQKSVFVIPYPCVKEIKFLAEYYNIRKNIRLIEARSIDHEKEIMKHFKL
jgi:phenylacetic acid degradation operon negative regulatory protein